jgi:deazaflavin-dependent oxidoreductase (nitroreductase family)
VTSENVIAELRANRGHVGGELADTPIVLVHHVGAKTRTKRVAPLAYSSQPDGCLIIAASNGGSKSHPAWYHNLKAQPTICVELGTETFITRAEEITGGAHAALWSRLTARSPALREYQARTARRIPLFELRRLSCAAVVQSDDTSPSIAPAGCSSA